MYLYSKSPIEGLWKRLPEDFGMRKLYCNESVAFFIMYIAMMAED